MRLGLVTYLVAAEMSLEQAVAMCVKHGYRGLELRTTHRHGVEPALSPAARREVRQRFEDSGITLWGLGTACEFHSRDENEVRQNVETARQFVLLAHDVGAVGIKVRPNGLQTGAGIPAERTLEQIGRAFGEVGRTGQDHGIETWMEVHGPETSEPENVRRIVEVADHANCSLCWNSNPTDVAADGTIDAAFALLSPWVRSCHINELASPSYPYRRLFELLRKNGYGERFTLAEIPGTTDPDRFLPYYRALWKELARE
jgi:sugar phosphate isomerase/epimerase